MKTGILFKGKMQDPIGWLKLFISVCTFLITVLSYTGFLKHLFELSFFKILFFIYISSFIIILLIASKIEKKIDYFALIGIGIPFIIIVIGIFYFISNEDFAMFIIPFQIVTFGVLIGFYSGHLFQYIWGIKKGFLMKKWNNLPKEIIESRYKEAKIIIYSLPFMHLLYALIYLFLHDILLFLEQAGIGVLFFIVSIWFYRNKNSIRDEPKKIAASFFYIILFIITFDSILAEILYLTKNNIWYMSVYFIVFISISSIQFFIYPEKSRTY